MSTTNNNDQKLFMRNFNEATLEDKVKMYKWVHDLLDSSFRKRLLYMIGCECVYHQRKECHKGDNND